jgi:hypothetical protein
MAIAASAPITAVTMINSSSVIPAFEVNCFSDRMFMLPGSFKMIGTTNFSLYSTKLPLLAIKNGQSRLAFMTSLPNIPIRTADFPAVIEVRL